MASTASSRLRAFHALRIKGFATADSLVELADLDLDDLLVELRSLEADGLARLREQRALWQLTPEGRERHAAELAASVDHTALVALAGPYAGFLALNHDVKGLCGRWQLRGDVPNDHADPEYDRSVLDELTALDARAQGFVTEFAAAIERFGPYGRRLATARDRLMSGETNMFTGVMCGSYHDVWMELHEDLILTQGIDRNAEGSW